MGEGWGEGDWIDAESSISPAVSLRDLFGEPSENPLERRLSPVAWSRLIADY
jgi:hypothetical protein